MGDPKKQRKKYETPLHPWQGARIEEEKVLSREYGLRNKKEIWKTDSLLRSFKRQAKNLIASHDDQSQLERKQLIDRLTKLNLIKKDSSLDEVLSLDIKNIMERRLQTFVYRKELAKSIKQARQFIIHGHITVNDKKISSPSYVVKLDEEDKIGFALNSELKNPEHAERKTPEKLKDIKTQMKVEKKAEVKEGKVEVKEKIKEIKEDIKKGNDAKGPKEEVPSAHDLDKK
jgi:small subunit ribosomal protein S4